MRSPSTRRRLVLAATLGAVLLGAPSPRAVSADEPVAFEGKRVRVVSRILSNRCAELARDAGDALVSACEEHLPYRLPAGEKMVFLLYGKPEDYRDALKKAGAETAAQNLTTTLIGTRETYVLAQPRPETSFLSLVGDLPESMRFALCREGVRQFLLRAKAPGYDYWPDWYADGMASFLAEQNLRAREPKDAPPSLYLDDRRHLAQDDLARGRFLRLDRTLHAWQGEAQPLERRSLFMQWSEFYRLLASEPEKLKDLHVRIRDLGEPPAPAKDEADRRFVFRDRACSDALTGVYGPLAPLETRLKAQIEAAKPEWFEPLRSTQRVGDTFVVAAQPSSVAFAIRVAPAPKVPFALTCEVQVKGVEQKQADLYLAFEDRRDPRFIKIQLRTDGVLAVMAFAHGMWQERLGLALDARGGGVLPEGTWVPVRVEADAGHVSVDVSGKRVIDADVPLGYDVLGNQVGIGAFREVALFRKIEVAPLKR